MSLEFLNFGSDITRVRMELGTNLQLLKTKAVKKELFLKFKKAVDEKKDFNLSASAKWQKASDKQRFLLFSYLIERFVIDSLEHLNENPFWVNPVYVMLCEVPKMLAPALKEEQERNEQEEKENQKILRRLFNQFGKYHAFVDDELEKADINDVEKWMAIHDEFTQPYKIDAPEFDYFFAMTLRQMPVVWIDDFFEYQSSKFPSKKKFVRFLKNILLEYPDLIPEKNRTATAGWLEEESERPITPQAINIQHAAIKANELKIDTAEGKGGNSGDDQRNELTHVEFQDPPFEHIRLDLNAESRLIRKFLSFLSSETNGGEKPFTSNSDLVEYLDKYGLVVPSYPLNKRFTLDLVDDKRSDKVVLKMFYQFFKKYKKRQDQKAEFVRLLKNTFTNFDSYNSEKNPNNFLRNYELPKQNNKIKIENYM